MKTNGFSRIGLCLVAIGIAAVIAGCMTTVQGKPEVINPTNLIASLPQYDLRAGLYVRPRVRRYTMETGFSPRTRPFAFGADVTASAEEHFARVFKIVRPVNSMPPPPAARDDIDIVISIGQPQGELTGGPYYLPGTMQLAVPFSIHTPDGTLIHRIEDRKSVV